MKIVYITHGTHWEAAIEPVLETLAERGHEVIKCIPAIRNQERIPKEVDIVFLTSSEDIPITDKRTKIYFIPHGIGDERWDPFMDTCNKVLLPGRKPWTLPQDLNNWKIVGWAKSDVLFDPKKEKIEYVNNLINTLPYDESALCVPLPHDLGTNLHFLVEYFDKQGINVIAPYQEFHDNALSYFRNYNNVVLPNILNLYYFAPHVKLVVCSGFTSIGREFYITKIPTVHLYQGFPESINLSDPNAKNFDLLYSMVCKDPKEFLQPESIVKQFIEINDGKVVERIIKEVEKI